MTAGLKPYRAYKDSGVEWLGKVPTHWSVTRLKYSLANIVEQAANLSQADIVVALENVESWTGRVMLSDSAVAFDSQLKRFQAGDILFGKLRPYLAKVAQLARGGSCVGEFLVLRPRHGNVVGQYFEHLLRSRPIIEAVTASTYGAKMPRTDWQFIGGMPVVHPPPIEQAAIVRFLDHADRRIRRYIRAKEKLIGLTGGVGLIQEFRTRLIADMVTGKLDVREAAAELPQVDPLAIVDTRSGHGDAADGSLSREGAASTEIGRPRDSVREESKIKRGRNVRV